MNKQKAIGLMLLQCLFAASNVIFLSEILHVLNAETLLFFRWLIVVIILFPVMLKHEGSRLPKRKDLWLLFVMGIMSVVVGNIFAFKAYAGTSTTNIGFIGALGTSVTAILSFAFLGEQFSRYKIWGIALAFAGVVISISGGTLQTIFNLHLRSGDWYIAGAMLANSIYAIIGKHISNSGSAVSVVFYSSLFGWAAFLPYGVTKIYIPGDITLTLVFCLFFISVIATLAARWIFMISIKHLSASEAGLINNTIPILTAIFSFCFLGAPLKAVHFAGWIIITIGVLVFYREKSKVRLV